MNYNAATLAQLQRLAQQGDTHAAYVISRRNRTLQSLRAKLAKHLQRPAPTTKRGATYRERDERILRRQIKTLEQGRPLADWYEVKL